MVMAAQALAKEAENFQLVVDGTPAAGALNRTLREGDLEAKPIVILNPGQAAARAVISVSGAPSIRFRRWRQGFKIERSIWTMKGQQTGYDKLKQNDRYVVHLKMSEPKSRLWPACSSSIRCRRLEIENPNLRTASRRRGSPSPRRISARPCRGARRPLRRGLQPQRQPEAGVTISYIVRAVTPGRYIHPGAFVEDMYRPDRFGPRRLGVAEVQAAR